MRLAKEKRKKGIEHACTHIYEYMQKLADTQSMIVCFMQKLV